MNASIHSRDDEKDLSPGRTHRVFSDNFAISCYGGELTVTATDGEVYFPQDYDAITPPRDITRTLRLSLTAKDIKQLLDAAIKANILEAEFNIPTPKKKNKR